MAKVKRSVEESETGKPSNGGFGAMLGVKAKKNPKDQKREEAVRPSYRHVGSS